MQLAGLLKGTGSSVGGLVGGSLFAKISASYWDSDTSGISDGSGEAKTTEELQSPTDFIGSIYSSWDEDRCNDGSRAWNLGGSYHYPALTCTSDGFTAQRSYVAEGLRAIPEDGAVTLIWDNPYADIASISISYHEEGSSALEYFPLITSGDQLNSHTRNVQQVISNLANEGYYNFIVSLTLQGEDAGKEGEAPSIIVAIGPDLDKDSVPNFLDVDDNGNGLIEIATADELNQVRHNLLGSSFQASAEGEGDVTGCGGQGGIKTCNGYELVADISLTSYDNWQPIGICDTSNNCPNAYDSIFEGNGHTISDLTIISPVGNYAGLFGAISADSILRNIHIRSASINGGANSVNNVGLLAGYAREAMIINSSAGGEIIGSANNVGGLVGDGQNIVITSSYTEDISVKGESAVGGLVGSGNNINITSSYMKEGAIIGTANVGGLIGSGWYVSIVSSYAAGREIRGDNDKIGGLIGNGWYANIISSYATVMNVGGDNDVGGLIGDGREAKITSSNATIGTVSGTGNNVGGLVGKGMGSFINSSYAEVGTVSGDDSVGGLVGSGERVRVTSSNAEVGTVSGDDSVGGLVGLVMDLKSPYLMRRMWILEGLLIM